MAFIIELFGIPGAGKTTLRGQLIEQLKAAGLDAKEPVPRSALTEPRSDILMLAAKVVGRLRLCVQNWRVIVWSLNVLRRSPRPFREKTAAIRFVVATLERYDICRRDTEDRVYVIDEGSLQRLFLLLVEYDGVRLDVDLSAYIDTAPFGDLLVHVNATPHQALHRLALRDRGLPPRLRGLDNPQAELRLIEGHDLLLSAAAEAVAAPESDRPVRQLTQLHT